MTRVTSAGESEARAGKIKVSALGLEMTKVLMFAALVASDGACSKGGFATILTAGLDRDIRNVVILLLTSYYREGIRGFSPKSPAY